MARGARRKSRDEQEEETAPGDPGDPRDPQTPREPHDSAGSLDRVIHERTRLSIMSALAVREPLSFSELKSRLGLTDGNLSVHARRLEEVGYVECKKRFEGRVPRTEYVLTAAGRRALSDYLAHMEALIQSMRESAADLPAPHAPKRSSRTLEGSNSRSRPKKGR